MKASLLDKDERSGALLVRLGAKILQIGNDSVEPGDLLVELLAFYQVMGQVLLGLV